MKETLLAVTVLLVAHKLHATESFVEEGNWTRTFKFGNGITIVHTPESVLMNLGGFNMKVKTYQFSAGSSINGIKPLADGELSTTMSLNQFRREAQKYGPIVYEQEQADIPSMPEIRPLALPTIQRPIFPEIKIPDFHSPLLADLNSLIKVYPMVPSTTEIVDYCFAAKGDHPYFPFYVTGLSSQEDSHTWSTQKLVTMKIPNFYDGKRVKNLSFIETSALVNETYEQRVTLFLDKEKINEYKYILPHLPSHTIDVFLPFTNSAEREILFEIPTSTLVRNVHPESSDPRELGICFKGAKITLQKDR